MKRNREPDHKRHKRGPQKAQKIFGVTRLQLSFLDKVFRRAHSPPRRGGVSATSKKWIRSDLSRTGWSVRRPFERPAELTTITASRYRARASRPSAPPLWLRGIFWMAQPLLMLRAIALALRALLCEEGNRTHSSSVHTATSSPLVAA